MGWSGSNIPALNGRVAVVTGTGGLGFETGLALARAGAEVILAGRNPVSGAASLARIGAAAPRARVSFELLDLASLASIEAFVRRLSDRVAQLDLLVNNAGVMMPPMRRTTGEGFELQFGTNHLGHFALTGRVVPLLRKAAAPRVINVTSQAYLRGRIDFEDPQAQRSYRPFRAYAQSKLAQVLFALELQRRSDRVGWSVLSSAAHPGWAKTELFRNGPGARSLANRINTLIAEPFFAQSAADGALPILYAATSPEADGGALFGPGGFLEMRGAPRRAAIVSHALRADVAQRLWELSETLTGLRFELPAAA